MLGFVGKAVTFDSGGISLKPGPKMAEMKFDMSGGAAVLEAVEAIARLQLPVKLVAVVGATENLPSGRSVKPGDIVTASNGKTIEVNNTDAEGRLVLADCLCHAISRGRRAAGRPGDAHRRGDHRARVDLRRADVKRRRARRADRGRPASVRARSSGGCPFTPSTRSSSREPTATSTTRPEEGAQGGHDRRRAVPVELRRADVPWAHLDIAGSAWDLGRAYVGKGASGYGVRLLVELARSYGA